MDKLKITILYDAVEDKAKAEAAAMGDKSPFVFEQIADVLTKQGHQVTMLAAERKVKNLVGLLEKDNSDVIFNVCESLGGESHHEQNVAAMLELMEKRFTGSGALGLTLAQDKALSKKLFAFHGIRYPKFSTMEFGQVEWSDKLKFPLFVKPMNEDASIGIDAGAIVRNVKELMERISYIHTEIRKPALIEEYIDGREIYVGVIGNDKPEALPIVEWDFSKLPKDTPRIATAEAKWDEDSEAFRAPEIFPVDIPDEVYKRIQQAAVNAYKTLKLRDYGRVDIRLRQRVRPAKPAEKPEEQTDETKKNGKTEAPPPAESTVDDWEFYVIEVNPNPFLDKKGELAIAARKQGLKYPQLIERIVESALKRKIS